MMERKKGTIYKYIIVIAAALASCKSEYPMAKHVNKVPANVERSDEYLAKQSIEITSENIENKDYRTRRSQKRSEKEQKRLNELNKPTYKPKIRKTNDRVYDIY